MRSEGSPKRGRNRRSVTISLDSVADNLFSDFAESNGRTLAQQVESFVNNSARIAGRQLSSAERVHSERRLVQRALKVVN